MACSRRGDIVRVACRRDIYHPTFAETDIISDYIVPPPPNPDVCDPGLVLRHGGSWGL